jgi:HEAT repeat protein
MDTARRRVGLSGPAVVAALVALLLSAGVAGGAPEGAGGAASGPRPVELPFSTGFEKTAVGAFPAPFEGVPGRPNSRVTDAKAHRGRRSLKLTGRGNLPACPCLVLPTGLDTVTFETAVYLGLLPKRQVSVGLLHFRKRSARFHNAFILRRRGESDAVTLSFRGGEEGEGRPLGTVFAGKWVLVKARIDFRNRTADLWVNGRELRKGVPAAPQTFTSPRRGAVVLDRWAVKEPNRRGGASEILIDDVRIHVEEGRGEFEKTVARLADGDPRVRRDAATALGRLGNARATHRLIEALRDPDAEVRAAAARALGLLGDPRAVEPLRVLHREGERPERKAAAEALARLGIPVAPEPPTLVDLLSRGQCREVARKGAAAVEPLIEALKHADPRVKCGAVSALAAIGDARAVEPLIAALSDPEARRAAADALGKIRDRRAVKPLAILLRDPDEPVRRTAMRALAAIGGRDVEAMLLDLLEKPESRLPAAVYLASMGHERGCGVLFGLLEDDDPDVRRKSADALGALAHRDGPGRAWKTRITARLAKALEDEDIMVARIAAESLSGIDDPVVIAALVKALESEDFMRFERAGQALARTGWEPATDTHRARLLVARWKFDAAAKLGEPAVAPLIAVLAVDHERARFGAARALGTMGAVAKPAIPALLEVARNEKEEGLTRLVAAKAVEAIRGKPKGR